MSHILEIKKGERLLQIGGEEDPIDSRFIEIKKEQERFERDNREKETCTKLFLKRDSLFISSDLGSINSFSSGGELNNMQQVCFRSLRGQVTILMNDQKSFIGEGRYSRVYQGEYHRMGEENVISVAIKFILSDFSNEVDLEQELKLHEKLKYFNGFCTCIDSNRSLDFALKLNFSCIGFMILPLMKKFEINSIFNENRENEIQRLFEIIEELHSLKAIHHDIKPQNFLKTINGELCLGDFSSVRLLKDSIETDKKEETGMGMEKEISKGNLSISESFGLGTLFYTAPELLSNNSDLFYDQSIDMYSIGVMLYSIVTGRKPFEDLIGTSTVKQLISVKKGFFESGYNPISDNLKYGDLIRRLTLKDPKKRPTASQVLSLYFNAKESGNYANDR